jgi:hypothetical protein
MRVLEPKMNPRVTYQRLLETFSESIARELTMNNRSNLDCFADYIEQYVGDLEVDAVVAADLLFNKNNYHNIALAVRCYGKDEMVMPLCSHTENSYHKFEPTFRHLQTVFADGNLTHFLASLIEKSLIPLFNAYVTFTKQKGRFTPYDLFHAETNVLDFMTTKPMEREHKSVPHNAM